MIGWLVISGTSCIPLLSDILAVWGQSPKQIFGTVLSTMKWYGNRSQRRGCLHNTAVVECPGLSVESDGSCHVEGPSLGLGHIVKYRN
jgi:hypothetical protein